MTRVHPLTNVVDDNLVCPITLQLFRDPVIAADGRVYERKAITRWIFEHGTSPFTRQILNVDDLVGDDYLKSLAAERRGSAQSYDSQNSITTTAAIVQRVQTNEIQIPTATTRTRSVTSLVTCKFVFLFCCLIWILTLIGIILSLYFRSR